MMTIRNQQLLAVAGLALLAFAPPAFAYLDPSTGSMILSAIVGLFATMALAIKTYWYRLKAFFRGDRRSSETPEKADPPAGDSSQEN